MELDRQREEVPARQHAAPEKPEPVVLFEPERYFPRLPLIYSGNLFSFAFSLRLRVFAVKKGGFNDQVQKAKHDAS